MTLRKVEEFGTPHQMLAEFRDHTGQIYIVKPFEKALGIKLELTEAAILLEVFELKERARGWTVLGHGKRILSFKRERHGWRKIGQLDIMDENFEPFEIANFGRSKTVQEYVEQIWFERDCYRPGTGQFPQDNYYRQVEGYTDDHEVTLDTRSVKV